MWSTLKSFFRKRVILQYDNNGSCYVFLRFPIKINYGIKYEVLCANKPIVPNKIVFDNYMGQGYGGNPKYIAEKILEKYPGKYDLVWCVKEKKKEHLHFPEGIRTVEYQSLEAYQEYATARIWISNYHKISYLKKGLKKRKGQFFIQTWHGSLGIKRIEKDVAFLNEDVCWNRLARLSSQMVDIWISNSCWETEIYRHAFWNVKNVLEVGHPRNDILFGNKSETAQKKVKDFFNIEGKNILLYAPTFREDYRLECYDVNFDSVHEALSNRFGGEWEILIRLHPRIQKYVSRVIQRNIFIKNATAYDDIQELVAAADIMLTDYSSCIFDFVLTRKPGFIFAPDQENYEKERGFYYPLEKTPFSISHTSEQLVEQILGFDEKCYKHKVDEFLIEKGCVDDGYASERVVQKIDELINSVL